MAFDIHAVGLLYRLQGVMSAGSIPKLKSINTVEGGNHLVKRGTRLHVVNVI